MKKYAVIVAGGSGLRMGSSTPKQFLLLQGVPVLQHTLTAFLQAYTDLQIILVLPAAHIMFGEEMITSMKGGERAQIVEGGDTRFQSVKNGLAYVERSSVVFVHDGVRCLISAALIRRCYEQAVEKGSAIPAVAATDSVRIEEGNQHTVIDRNKIRIIQTPQTFLSDILVDAFQQQYQPSFTDEATVVEAAGQQVHLIEGDYNNIKITRPVDLYIAEKLLQDNLSLKPS
jgi:2-C-methyl-D-erythritol 4-phosphate cytidylyltransferase